jgi:hypothetical protein
VRSKAYELCAAAAANTVRCAIYTGKSSEEGLEQEFNSLQAQREACEVFIVAHRAPPISGPVRWTFAFGGPDNRDIFPEGAISGTFWRFQVPNRGLIGPGGARLPAQPQTCAEEYAQQARIRSQPRRTMRPIKSVFNNKPDREGGARSYL